MTLSDFQNTFKALSDEDLLRVAADEDSLVEEAKDALGLEMGKRGLAKKRQPERSARQMLDEIGNADFNLSLLASLDSMDAFHAWISRAYAGEKLSERRLNELGRCFSEGHRIGAAHERNSGEYRFFQGFTIIGIFCLITIVPAYLYTHC